jgi:molybdopterin-guanine dinucleotide biosynthesis protein A
MRKEMLTAAILAGGTSMRLGKDKAYAEVGTRPMLERAIAAVEPLAEEILVVGRTELDFPAGHVRCVPDEQAGLGPLGGLASALIAASYDRVLCTGCDMPFLSTELLSRLVRVKPLADAAVLRVGCKVEPLCAVYHKRVHPIVLRLIRDGERRMQGLLQTLDLAYIDVGLECETALFNVNTPEDLAAANRLAQTEGRQTNE